jgi:hypothetical protein
MMMYYPFIPNCALERYLFIENTVQSVIPVHTGTEGLRSESIPFLAKKIPAFETV